MATAILAPDEIPRTKGPAMGFSKKVCSRKPESASAPPRIADIRILGNRIFQTMLISSTLPERVKIICRILPSGIFTFPVLIFRMIMAQKAAASNTKTSV